MSARIDSHQHFWRRDRGDYGWLTPALGPIYRDYGPEDLAPYLARQGIAATILVQAAPTIAETRFMLGLAHAHPFIAGVVGWVDFESDTAADDIATLAAEAKLVGLRPMIQDIPDADWMLRDALAPAFEAMIEHDLVFDALVLPKHLANLRELLDRYPELRVVLDHAAKPPLAPGHAAPSEFGGWQRDVAALARETPLVCKLSGLVTEAGSAEPARLAACVDHLLECFGPERLLWGSDWPVCELVCTYDEWCSTSDALLARLDPAARERIHSANSREVYGI